MDLCCICTERICLKIKVLKGEFVKLNFSKMHGCGNDYIYFNCLENELKNPGEISRLLSRRRFCVGADGVVLICRSNVADVKMRMFNADGSEGKMCGNAIRCVAKYVVDGGIVMGDVVNVETLSGIKTVEVQKENGKVKSARVNMGAYSIAPGDIPVAGGFSEPLVGYSLKIDDQIFKITCVSMGNPHCVVFCENLQQVDLCDLGPKFEKNDLFPEGVNTEFVQVLSSDEIKMKVWERGSGATLACGTGASASVVAGVLNGFCRLNSVVKVNLPGGVLKVEVTENSVFLTGEAVLAFEGTVEV